METFSLNAKSDSLLVRSVRLHGIADGLWARQHFEAVLANIDLTALGLPRRTLLIIRRIAPTARLRLDPSGPTGAFAHSVHAELSRNAQQARRPWLHGDATGAEAVLFADEAELMACLVRDWLRGTLAGRWWGSTLLGGLPATEWLRRNLLPRGDQLPAVLSLLSEQGRAVAWVACLNEAEVTQAVTAIIAAHAMNTLSEWIKPVPLLRGTEQPKANAVSASLQDQQTKTHISAPPSGSLQDSIAAFRHLIALIPELQANTLTISQRRLLALALGLQRASGWTRSPAFVVALQAMERGSSGGKDSVPDNISKANDANSADSVAKESKTNGSNLTDKLKPVAHSVEQRFDKALPSAAEGLGTDGVLSIPLDDLWEKKTSPAGEGGMKGNINKEKSLFISPNPDPFGTAQGRLIPEGKGVSIIESSALPPVVYLPNHEEGLAGTLHNDTQAEVLPSLPALSPEFTPHPNNAPATLIQQSIDTQFGGLFYLLNVALALGLYGDFTQPCAPGISLSPWDWLALTGRAWFGRAFEQDPVWRLLAELAGRSASEEPGHDFLPPDSWRVADEWLKPWGKAVDLGTCTKKREQLTPSPSGRGLGRGKIIHKLFRARSLVNAKPSLESTGFHSTRHPGRDSRQAFLPDALRINANLFQTDLCRDPEAMDGNSSSFQPSLGEQLSHPCDLGSGNPCRNDGNNICADSYANAGEKAHVLKSTEFKPLGEVRTVKVYATRKRLQIWHEAGFILVDVARNLTMAPLAQASELCTQSEVLGAVQFVHIYRQPNRNCSVPLFEKEGVGEIFKSYLFSTKNKIR